MDYKKSNVISIVDKQKPLFESNPFSFSAEKQKELQMLLVREWDTQRRLKARVYLTKKGFSKGYVSIPKEHPLYGSSYDKKYSHNKFEVTLKDTFLVHGNVNFSGLIDSNTDFWWFGFSCLVDPAYRDVFLDIYRGDKNLSDTSRGHLAFMYRECENFSYQLNKI